MPSSSQGVTNTANTIHTQMMTNWLAMAHAQQHHAAAAAATAGNTSLGGMVPNPMLAPTTTLPGMFHHPFATLPNYPMQQQQQPPQQQVVATLPPSATPTASSTMHTPNAAAAVTVTGATASI